MVYLLRSNSHYFSETTKKEITPNPAVIHFLNATFAQIISNFQSVFPTTNIRAVTTPSTLFLMFFRVYPNVNRPQKADLF